MCGEKCGYILDLLGGVGSPPRVRGKASTATSPSSYPLDHPRVCGEKTPHTCRKTCATGSPPRVRGKVLDPESVTEDDRITPACAGKSSFAVVPVGSPWDHPRVCGEKSIIQIILSVIKGSPPRVRGKASTHHS